MLSGEILPDTFRNQTQVYKFMYVCISIVASFPRIHKHNSHNFRGETQISIRPRKSACHHFFPSGHIDLCRKKSTDWVILCHEINTIIRIIGVCRKYVRRVLSYDWKINSKNLIHILFKRTILTYACIIRLFAIQIYNNLGPPKFGHGQLGDRHLGDEILY